MIACAKLTRVSEALSDGIVGAMRAQALSKATCKIFTISGAMLNRRLLHLRQPQLQQLAEPAHAALASPAGVPFALSCGDPRAAGGRTGSRRHTAVVWATPIAERLALAFGPAAGAATTPRAVTFGDANLDLTAHVTLLWALSFNQLLVGFILVGVGAFELASKAASSNA
jgi:hypothetical protein